MISLAIRHRALVAALACLPQFAASVPATGATIGLPITRNYALDEIGDVSRGVRLGFDPIGRLAVIGGGCYVVLNDSTWIDVAYKGIGAMAMARVVCDAAGNAYFGALATWGVAEYTAKGELRPRSVRPQQVPEWVTEAGFVHVLPLGAGVYFAGLNGVVYWDRSTDEHAFFRVPGATTIFALGSQVFVSSHLKGTERLDLKRRSVDPIGNDELAGVVIEHAVALRDGRALVATVTGRLLVFDGTTMTAWVGPLGGELSGRVTGLQRLTDGGIAVAVDGRGLFILSESGEVRLALTSPEYHRIHDLVTREPGVLWVAIEGVVQKLLYGSPVTIVDRRLNVPIGWPQVVQWRGRTVIASSGRLYESAPAADGMSLRFEPVAQQPGNDTWGIAARGARMLVGNRDGVYSRDGDTFAQVMAGFDVDRLVMVSPDFCYVIGTQEIAALRCDQGRWSECAPRVPGVGFPSVVHAAAASAWVELGANRVARISLVDGRLQTRVIDQFPWSELLWVNLGVVGHTVVLSGRAAGVLFFDEDSGDFRDVPELRALLANAPFPVARVMADARGNLWASHDKGVFVLRSDSVDASARRSDESYPKVVREFQPLIQIVGDDDVWLSTQKTLYHVTRDSWMTPRPPAQPVLVAVTEQHTRTELFSVMHPHGRMAKLPYSQNSLEVRFFSGSYAAMRPPVYEFTMSGGSGSWSTHSTDSLLVLHDLKEGTYRLTARLADQAGPTPEPVVLDFAIAPPWHRSPLAFAGYGIGAVLSGCGVYYWAIRRARRRNAVLEKLVRDRTEELRSTMARLNEETHNAATLAERNRLAGEIHDSLQQGLSGLMLQLDATLKLSDLAADIRSKLTVARNMVSFTRHEVQQAVWNLESPLLENADLTAALKKMAGLISSGKPQVEIKTSGVPTDVPSSITHQLLRIAQEAITNAVRHGHAQKIFVHLEFSDQEVSLEIFDDGCGFVPKEVFASGIGHFGLRGLRGRASRINADLKIISAPNRGTTVRIVVPFARAATPADATVASV